jgi:hypothetical protein
MSNLDIFVFENKIAFESVVSCFEKKNFAKRQECITNSKLKNGQAFFRNERRRESCRKKRNENKSEILQ